MRTTVFELRSGEVVPDLQEEPSWEPFEDYDGRPLERVRVQGLLTAQVLRRARARSSTERMNGVFSSV